VFSLNENLRAKVRILMPKNLHDVVQKALIAEEELISGGQTRTPARPAGQASSGAQQHQTPAIHTSGYRGFQRGSTFTTPHMTDASVEDTLSRTTTSATTSTAAATVWACSAEQTRVPGWWVVIFYFRYQDYWAKEGVLDVWGATLPA
jgi:hypothetical protein